MEHFVRSYLDAYNSLTEKLTVDKKRLILPKYLFEKCQIDICISKINGVSIKFIPNQKKESMKFEDTNLPIEDRVLPSLSNKGKDCFFVVDGARNIVKNLNLIERSVYERNRQFIEQLARSTNLVMDNPIRFIELLSGDLKLIDCTLAYTERGKDKVENINCLWLFATNNSTFFSKENAELIARLEYEQLTSALTSWVPIRTLAELLSDFKGLIDNKNTTEPDMQDFFKKHWIFLDILAKMVFPKFDMGGVYIPDFIVETSDNRYILVEIESPNVELYTKEKSPRQAEKLREADTQIKDYYSYALNHIDLLKDKLPFLTAEKVKGLIIIGKSKSLSEIQKLKLEKDRASNKNHDLLTYDELYEGIKTFLDNIGLKYTQFTHS